MPPTFSVSKPSILPLSYDAIKFVSSCPISYGASSEIGCNGTVLPELSMPLVTVSAPGKP